MVADAAVDATVDRVSQWTLATTLDRQTLARVIDLVEQYLRDWGRKPTPEELAALLGAQATQATPSRCS